MLPITIQLVLCHGCKVCKSSGLTQPQDSLQDVSCHCAFCMQDACAEAAGQVFCLSCERAPCTVMELLLAGALALALESIVSGFCRLCDPWTAPALPNRMPWPATPAPLPPSHCRLPQRLLRPVQQMSLAGQQLPACARLRAMAPCLAREPLEAPRLQRPQGIPSNGSRHSRRGAGPQGRMSTCTLRQSPYP